MANLPETNLTAHWDASVSTGNIYAGPLASWPPTGAVAHNEQAAIWKSSVGAYILRQSEAAARAVPADMKWKNDTTMYLPSIQIIKGTYEGRRASNSEDLKGDDLINAGAKTVAISFLITGTSKLLNSGNSYGNTNLFGDPSGNYNGLFLRNNAGTLILYAYTWDGAEKQVNVSGLTTNTPYVAVYTHNGTNLILSVYDPNGQVSTTKTVAAGNTSDVLIAQALAASNAAFTEQAEIRVGEIVTYDAALSGGTLTQLTTYMRDRWTAVSSSGGHGKGQGGNHGGGKSIVVISRHRRTERRRK